MLVQIALVQQGLQHEASKSDPRRARRSVLAVANFVLCTALSLSDPASAQSVAPAALAAPCMACHGPQGTSPGAIPSIRGVDASSMSAKLRAFRNGEIEATVMTRIAKGYSADELNMLARYFADLKP